VERTEVAAAASGKAGGFLALDWCAGDALDALARRSFQLHDALRYEIAGDWAYRRMTTYSGFVVQPATAVFLKGSGDADLGSLSPTRRTQEGPHYPGSLLRSAAR